MTIEIIQGDITTLRVDALVNAANNELRGGGGVDGAIHWAGGPQILAECRAIGHCATGDVVRTTGGDLPVRHLLHTVGPVWSHLTPVEADELLKSCYLKSLELAKELGCRSIAFPNISTGVYGFPKERAAHLVKSILALWKWKGNKLPERCVFCCFDEENYSIYQEILLR